ncbi:uncharacterized protein RHOBADRAFT_51865 [Rhodotorula graminis WP1]|uniref:Nicotinamide-nucleotide adenylyltransferase n=1 Tax=Rhodotorula graminis (strain WP1) TaxID=578459 RepID=A0A194S8S9_RHOGW|nr:uncharacterized protein RHOBADRAFT_51865 [Rhodotorula graminis WP1]KPV76880.1 hypothetical protein RHOBADRAFT_51865 [Rhodotorula graminis WP1]
MAPRLPLPTSPSLPVAALLPRGEHTPFTLVYASHGRWPLSPDAPPPAATTASPRRLRVCVLESSWNPPHLAHIALAQHCPDADAHLLALTIGHPDKGRIDERVAAVRVEMMRAAALDLVRRAADSGDKALANVAVAVTEAPTFTDKSRLLRGELDALVQAQSGHSEDEVRLTFPVGWDTILRIFAPRYYQLPAPSLPIQMQALLGDDDSSLVCARRGDVSPQDEADFLASDEVRKWAQQGKVEVFDLPGEAQGVSSTRVRQAVQEGRWDDVARDVPFEAVVGIIRREALYRD